MTPGVVSVAYIALEFSHVETLHYPVFFAYHADSVDLENETLLHKKYIVQNFALYIQALAAKYVLDHILPCGK